MKIILAEDYHIPAMIEVWKDFMDYHKHLDQYFTRRLGSEANFQKYIKDLIKDEDALVLVALDDGKVVGHALARIENYPPVYEIEKFGLVMDMAINPDFRRKGIGEQMIAEVKEWFKSRNIKRLELDVAANNAIGNSFWKKHGFKEVLHRLYQNID